jgi:drug/metabolite transporter (DMT)-like permease
VSSAPPASEAAPTDARVLAGVFVAVASVSAAAIFIRLADAPALAIASWRNAIAVALLLPVVLARRETFPRGRPLRLALLSGVALAFHFALWISSLEHTSVAASVVLVCTQPIFVTLLSWWLLKERTSALAMGGIAVAFAGTLFIALDESVFDGALLGNLLALGGAVAVAAYVLIGRSVRAGGVALLPYATVVYATAAAVLLPATALLGVPLTGFSGETWAWLAAIAVFPQILGHTLFNWALKYVKAPVLSGTILLEPVVSTLLAWAVLAEVPGTQTLVGGAVVLAGLALLLRGRA